MEATILIIDDEDKLRSLLARILLAEGFHVLEASDGKSGLKKLAQESVDVILCDVRLPDDSGVNLVARLKQLRPASEVILLTAMCPMATNRCSLPFRWPALKNCTFRKC